MRHRFPLQLGFTDYHVKDALKFPDIAAHALCDVLDNVVRDIKPMLLDFGLYYSRS